MASIAIESRSDAVGAGTPEAGWVLALSGVESLLLAAVGSVWMARALARPVGELTASLARMAAARDLTGALPRSGACQELDALVDTFDTLRAALAKAEAESEDTYMGVIGTRSLDGPGAIVPFRVRLSTRGLNESLEQERDARALAS